MNDTLKVTVGATRSREFKTFFIKTIAKPD